MRDGNQFPVLIRKTEPKPIRVFLQDGSNDQNIYGGNWWIANQDMLSALEFAGYDVNHEWSDGGHSEQAVHQFVDQPGDGLFRVFQDIAAEEAQTFARVTVFRGACMAWIVACPVTGRQADARRSCH